ncbi:AI-2E family transporter [Haloarculaceae archaeon H-GB2-1]|nr:AI-2E family transporter [Haloarculaceae archaeon H-GB1-1]MEA5385828.1 AI-2E family transporter [Haloarculaceae archaeon H-GB11]MEA5407328.1 AI-2E family transporter [Haloarculaceae archaeon H-GB2-1]
MVTVSFDIDWSRVGWLAFGAVLLGAILFIVRAFIGTFVFGIFIYYATRRLYRRLRGRVHPPSLAAGLSILGLALPAVALLLYTVGIALQELDRFAKNADIGPLLNTVEPYLPLTDIVEKPGALLADPAGLNGVQTTLESLLGVLGFVGNGLLHLFVMFALAFYMLRDGYRVSAWLSNFGDQYGVLEEYVRTVDRSLDKVFYGNILNAVVTGTIGAIAYSLLNAISPSGIRIPYPALTGLLAGVASLIPVVGMKLVYVPVAGYLAWLAFTAGTGWAFLGMFVGISFVVVDSIPDFLIRPYVSRGSLHVGSLMFAYILGPLLFGWYGIFLGPILLVLFTHFARIVLPELLVRTPIQPYAVDPASLTGHVQEPDER